LHACEEPLTASILWLLACLTMMEIFIIGIFIFIHSLNISKLFIYLFLNFFNCSGIGPPCSNNCICFTDSIVKYIP
jgi:hypothetical protein